MHAIQSAVEQVIQDMDEYFLSKEEWDTIVELGLDDHKDDIVMKKISTATKTQLTRKSVCFEQFCRPICLVACYSCTNFFPFCFRMFPLDYRYNSTEHPIAFHKAQEFGKMPKKLAGGPAPDLEDVFDVSI